MEQGTAPFNVFVNNEKIVETSQTVFSVEVKNGDYIQVKSYVACEGEFNKRIALNKVVKAYPNPSKGFFEILLATSLEVVSVELYNVYSQLILAQQCLVENGKIQLNLTSQPSGLYLAKIMSENPVLVKLIKK